MAPRQGPKARKAAPKTISKDFISKKIYLDKGKADSPQRFHPRRQSPAASRYQQKIDFTQSDEFEVDAAIDKTNPHSLYGQLTNPKGYTYGIELISQTPFTATGVKVERGEGGLVRLVLNVKPQAFKFLHLPPELRLAVYEMVFPHGKRSIIFASQSRAPVYGFCDVEPPGLWHLKNLMCVNRMIHSEVCKWVYGSMEFKFGNFNSASGFLRPQGVKSLGSVFRNLSKVTITMQRIGARLPGKPKCCAAFEGLSRCTNLSKLRIEICCADHAIHALTQRVGDYLLSFCEKMETNKGEEDTSLGFLEFVPGHVYSPCTGKYSREEDGKNTEYGQEECSKVKAWVIEQYARAVAGI